MEIADVQGDVVFTGDQIPAFADLLERLAVPQAFAIARLRTATKISRHPSLGELEWRGVMGDRARGGVPIAGVDVVPAQTQTTATGGPVPTGGEQPPEVPPEPLPPQPDPDPSPGPPPA